MAWNPSPKVGVARGFGTRFGKNKVLILALDETAGTYEIVTYGQTKQMCAEADQLGARIEAMIANGKLRI
jgi:hypothetical protein